MSRLDPADGTRLLEKGALAVRGRLVQASNATLLAVVALDGLEAACVYKPVAGERPLWDFPNGTLAARERAAYLVSEATGWAVVPPTVLREGPFGYGMCQLWVDPDPEVELVDVVPRGTLPPDWLPVLDALGGGGRPVTLGHADDARLRRMSVLDAVINNADRKGGHVLPMPDGHVYGVDHGVSFHAEDKLRTVLGGWAGEELDDESVEMLRRLECDLDGPLGASLAELLTPVEVACTSARVRRLLQTRRHPLPAEGWPAIPWPPF